MSDIFFRVLEITTNSDSRVCANEIFSLADTLCACGVQPTVEKIMERLESTCSATVVENHLKIWELNYEQPIDNEPPPPPESAFKDTLIDSNQKLTVAQYEERQQDFQTKIDQLENEVSDNSKLFKFNEEVKNELVKSNSRLVQAEEQIDGVKKRIAEMCNLNKQLTQDNEKLAEKHIEWKLKCENLEKQTIRYKEAYDKARIQRKEAMNLMSGLKSEYTLLTTKIEKQNSQAEKTRLKVQDLELSISRLKELNKALVSKTPEKLAENPKKTPDTTLSSIEKQQETDIPVLIEIEEVSIMLDEKKSNPWPVTSQIKNNLIEQTLEIKIDSEFELPLDKK